MTTTPTARVADLEARSNAARAASAAVSHPTQTSAVRATGWSLSRNAGRPTPVDDTKRPDQAGT